MTFYSSRGVDPVYSSSHCTYLKKFTYIYNNLAVIELFVQYKYTHAHILQQYTQQAVKTTLQQISLIFIYTTHTITNAEILRCK